MQHIVYYSKKKDKKQPKINGYQSTTGIRLDDFGPGDTKEVDTNTAEDLKKTYGFLTITSKEDMEKAAKAMEKSEKEDKSKKKTKTEKTGKKKDEAETTKDGYPKDWAKLRKLASDKGIYEVGDDKETVLNKLRKFDS